MRMSLALPIPPTISQPPHRCRRPKEGLGLTPLCPRSTPQAAPWSTARIWVALTAKMPTGSRWTAVATPMSLDGPHPATSPRWHPSRPSTPEVVVTHLLASSTPRAAPWCTARFWAAAQGVSTDTESPWTASATPMSRAEPIPPISPPPWAPYRQPLAGRWTPSSPRSSVRRKCR